MPWCLLEHGPAGVAQPVLRQVADAEARRLEHPAGVRLLEPRHHLEQRRLAGAVGPAQPDALAIGDLPGHVVEEDAVAERFGEAGELNHSGPAPVVRSGVRVRSGTRDSAHGTLNVSTRLAVRARRRQALTSPQSRVVAIDRRGLRPALHHPRAGVSFAFSGPHADHVRTLAAAGLAIALVAPALEADSSQGVLRIGAEVTAHCAVAAPANASAPASIRCSKNAPGAIAASIDGRHPPSSNCATSDPPSLARASPAARPRRARARPHGSVLKEL